jgi:hypothetical protein
MATTLYDRINIFKNNNTKPSDILLSDSETDENFGDEPTESLEEKALKFYHENLTKRPSEICQLTTLMREYAVPFEDYKPYIYRYGKYREFKFTKSESLLQVLTDVKSYCHTLVATKTTTNDQNQDLTEKFYYGDIFFGYVIENVICKIIDKTFNKNFKCERCCDKECNNECSDNCCDDKNIMLKVIYELYIKNKSFVHQEFFSEYCKDNEVNSYITFDQFILIISYLDRGLYQNYNCNGVLDNSSFDHDFNVSVVLSICNLITTFELSHSLSFSFQHTDGENGLIDVYTDEMIIDIKTTAKKPKLFCEEDVRELPANVVSCKDQLSIYATRLATHDYPLPKIICMINPVMNTISTWSYVENL